MRVLYPIRSILQPLVGFVRAQPVDADRRAPLPRGVLAMYFLLVGALGLGIVVSSVAGAWPTVSPPVAFVLLLFVSVAIGDFIAMPQGRENHVLTVFSDMLVTAAVAYFGLHWSILAVLVVSEALRYGRVLPLTGGPIGAIFNIGTHVVECAIAAGLVMLVGSHSVILLAALIAIAMVVVTSVVMTVTGLIVGDGIALGRSTLVSEWSYLAANFPFYTLALYTMSASPYAALIGMLGPTMLAFVSTHAQEQLVVAERQLGVDGLTGVANRRRMSIEIEDVHARSMATGSDLGVIMIDIDDFKLLNDTHGHQGGDRALVAAASAISDSCPAHFLTARYGGEEFAVLLPGIDAAGALAISERIRIAAKRALDPWRTTISVGVVHLPSAELRDLNPPQMLDIADMALYRSKAGGKNQVTVATSADIGLVRAHPHGRAELLLLPMLQDEADGGLLDDSAQAA